MDYRSQYGQDRLVDALLGHRRDGRFVDVGAHDGVTFSNSWFFENHRGWDGICFEPIPSLFGQCRANRKCTCINAAVADRTETLKFTLGVEYVEMLSGLSKFRDPLHVERTERDLREHGGAIREIDVQALNLNEVLASRNVTAVDFLSLDIEGGEFEVLKSIDFDAVEIRVISVEMAYEECAVRIKALLAGKGFRFVCSLGEDGVFVNKRFVSVLNPAYVRRALAYKAYHARLGAGRWLRRVLKRD